MKSPKESLRAIAMQYEEDVAVAEYLSRKYGGDLHENAGTPARIINWVHRLEPEILRDLADDLAKLESDGYKPLADSAAVTRLDDEWKGSGADAFCDRWGLLMSHIGDVDSDGLIRNLKNQVTDMRDLADKMETFQEECANAIQTYLAGLREKYIRGRVHSGDGSDEEILKEATEQGLQGAQQGAVFGPKGAAAGVTVGAVVGLVIGFVQANEKQARILVELNKKGAQTSEVFGSSMDDIRKSLNVIRPDQYGISDGRTPYAPIEGKDAVRNADPGTTDGALDGAWT